MRQRESMDKMLTAVGSPAGGARHDRLRQMPKDAGPDWKRARRGRLALSRYDAAGLAGLIGALGRLGGTDQIGQLHRARTPDIGSSHGLELRQGLGMLFGVARARAISRDVDAEAAHRAVLGRCVGADRFDGDQASMIRLWASVRWKPWASMSSRHSAALTPGTGWPSRVNSMCLKLVHGANFGGRLAPFWSRVKPKTRPGPRKMWICKDCLRPGQDASFLEGG